MAKCKRNRNRAKRNFTFKTPAANRNYKDTVFRMLFSDRKNLLSTFIAIQSIINNGDKRIIPNRLKKISINLFIGK